MGKFRFVHSADIHLGSFLHLEDMEDRPKLQELCREAVYSGFDNVCRIAIQSRARFLLLSGDLYDREARSIRANRFFVDCCSKLEREGIKVFVIAGNHDPVREYGEMFDLPSNVHLFSADNPEIIMVDGEDGEPVAAISGQSYKGRREKTSLHQRYPVSGDRVFRIAMLHTQLESGKSHYIPASLNELSNHPGFDYWALGHIHQPHIINQEQPVIAYSGTPQGRDFGEQGPGGCWLVEVDDTDVSHMEYRVTSPVVYRSFFVDIGCPELREADTLGQLEEHLIALARGMDDKETPIEGYIIRWEIGGRGKLHHHLTDDGQGMEQDICQTLRDALWNQSPFFWTDSISIHTASPVTDEVLDRHPMLRELMEQSILAIQQDSEVRKKLVATLGQAWITNVDHEEQDDQRLMLDDQTLEKLVEEASFLLLEGLAEGEEG